MKEAKKAKVIATRFGAVRHKAGSPDYSIAVMLEYAFTYGAYRSAKFEVNVTSASNEQDFSDTVKETLLDHLEYKFPSEALTERDILLFGL